MQECQSQEYIDSQFLSLRATFANFAAVRGHLLKVWLVDSIVFVAHFKASCTGPTGRWLTNHPWWKSKASLLGQHY